MRTLLAAAICVSVWGGAVALWLILTDGARRIRHRRRLRHAGRDGQRLAAETEQWLQARTRRTSDDR